MHICLKCGRVAQAVDEIEDGCPCGSKVFVFKREENVQRLRPLGGNGSPDGAQNGGDPAIAPASVASSLLSDDGPEDEPGHDYTEVWLSKGGKISPLPKGRTEGHAGMDIENIRQVRRGIFEVDLLGLKHGPLVVKDPDGIYYVRLPFEHSALPKHLQKDEEDGTH